MLMMSGKKSNISNKFMMQKRNNILVIDDDKLMRVSLKSLLEEKMDTRFIRCLPETRPFKLWTKTV